MCMLRPLSLVVPSSGALPSSGAWCLYPAERELGRLKEVLTSRRARERPFPLVRRETDTQGTLLKSRIREEIDKLGRARP